MSVVKRILALAGLVSVLAASAFGQSNFVTVTNYVTVTVTNVVVVTNAVKGTNALIGLAAGVNHKAQYPWTNSVTGGLTLMRGNIDTTLVSAQYDITKKTPKNEFTGTTGLAYGEQNSSQTVNNYKGSFQWNHLFTPHTYSYLRADGLHDYIADINYRLTVGPGAGYYLLKQTNFTLAVEAGVNFEGQSFGTEASSNNAAGSGYQGGAFATMRLADKLEYKINNHARIWQSVEVLPEVDQWDNYLVNFEVGAEASFTKSFSLKTYLDDNFDSRPAAEHVKNDLKLVTGIAYKF